MSDTQTHTHACTHRLCIFVSSGASERTSNVSEGVCVCVRFISGEKFTVDSTQQNRTVVDIVVRHRTRTFIAYYITIHKSTTSEREFMHSEQLNGEVLYTTRLN